MVGPPQKLFEKKLGEGGKQVLTEDYPHIKGRPQASKIKEP